MDATGTLPGWDTLAALDDDALPLLDVALLIARDEYPDLDPRRYALRVQGTRRTCAAWSSASRTRR